MAGPTTFERRPSARDGRPRTKFGTVEFPAEKHTLHGKGRHHTHVFPHSPGGANEKLGRDLWNVTIQGNFQATFAAYPDLYPQGLNTLRRMYETQQTATLVHPTVGEFPAFIIEWKQVTDPKIRSGEKVDIEFLEDRQALLLDVAFVSSGKNRIATDAAELDAVVALIRDQQRFTPAQLSVFDALQNTVNSLLAIRDTSAMYGNLLSAKVMQIQNLCQQVDSFSQIQDPNAYPMLNALQTLWATAQSIGEDIQSKQRKLQVWIVPRTMPLAQISSLLYGGDASRASDLLALNSDHIPNQLAVPASTVINYYPDK